MSPVTREDKKAGYKKLVAWQKAHELALDVYKATKTFPNEENYGITSQLRRAALSVPTNIVEGVGRQGKKELKHFVNIALGSLAEVEYLLEFCFEIRYLGEDQYRNLEMVRKPVGQLLWKFYKSL